MSHNDLVILNNEEGRQMVKDLCVKHGINFGEFRDLIDAEIELSVNQNRYGLFDRFDDILDQICDGE